MEDGVMTIEEIRFGDDTRGTGTPELSSTIVYSWPIEQEKLA